MKIVLVPLDERPCNAQFPTLMPKAGYELLVPPPQCLGHKRKPADRSLLSAWLLSASEGADACILSMDTLVYGGLIPSRLHHEPEETLAARMQIVKTLKARDPNLRIYAFQTIMRCPRFSNGDEEPDYYWDCGAEIHRYGVYTHKERLGILTEAESADLAKIKAKIPPEALADYTARRQTNLQVLMLALQWVRDGVIDTFLVPQDDSAPYGFTALDQASVTDRIKALGLRSRVPVYPAADDVGMTLLARAVNEAHGIRPKIYVYYASAQGPFVTPSFEDRTVDATVKNQILAAGCRRVYSLPECDIALAVNVGSEMLYLPKAEERTIPYDIERSLPEYLDFLKYALEEGKTVAVADIAEPTNSDLELVRLLRDEALLLKIHAYAGWNTSSNTIGTVLCESCLYAIGKDEAGNRAFLLHRYYDDVGYCSHTRYFVDTVPVPKYGLTVFELDGVRGKCVEEGKAELLSYMKKEFPSLAEHVEDLAMWSPWNRTFEMGICLKLKSHRSKE